MHVNPEQIALKRIFSKSYDLKTFEKKINKSIAYHYILICVVFRGKNSGKKKKLFYLH